MSQQSSEQQQQNTQFQGTTVLELEAWLQQHGINTSLYGVGASKPLELLLEEVAVGESILSTSSSGVQRTVSVVNVRILNPSDKSLYEATQILPTGIERPRNLPLSEKMLPSENWREAVIRGIDEELGSILVPKPDVSIDDTTYMKTEEVKESQSYPGLQTNYVCHRVDARVQGLPETNFITEEERVDGMLKHIWEWRMINSLNK